MLASGEMIAMNAHGTQGWKQVDVHLSGSIMRLVLTGKQTADLLTQHNKLRGVGEEWFTIGNEIFIELAAICGIRIQPYEKPLQDKTQEELLRFMKAAKGELGRGDEWKEQ